MKTHKVLLLALIVSAILAVSVEAGDRRGSNNGRSQVAPSRGSASVSSFSSGSGFRYGNGRMIGSAPRFSSIGPRSMPSQRFAQRSGYISRGNVGVFGQRSLSWHSDWDRHRDHFWNGHRCRFVNGSWFIFDIGFIPWFGWPYSDYYAYDYYYPYGYGGYGYGAYGYDPGVYDQSNYYDQGGYNNNDQSNYYDQRGNNYNGQSNSYDQGGNRSGS